MLADEVTHVKMGSDWLRRITANDPERQKAALDFQRTVDKLFSFGGFRGEEEENPVHLARKFRGAGRLHRGRDHRPRRRRRRGLRRGRRPMAAAAAAAAERLTALLALVLLDLHVGWAWVVIIGNGLAGRLGARRPLAAGAAHPRAVVVHRSSSRSRSSCRSRSAWRSWPARSIEAPQFHMFYGFVAIIAVGDHLLLPRTSCASRRYLLYGFGGLFLMGLGIRAMLVGQT